MMLASVFLSCIAVSGLSITAHHLAEAVPAFVPANPDAFVSYAPDPGIQRVFPGAELRQALGRFGYKTEEPLPNVCFARPVAVITTEAALKAMHTTLGETAKIQIVELSLMPAPEGELVFPREGLGTPPVALWRGYVKYDGGEKKFPVWARLMVTVPIIRAIANEELKPGLPIRASQIRMETEETFPERRTTAQSAKEIDGLLPARPITAGTPVWNDAVRFPPDVEKGQRVTVTVHSGNAQLSFDAEAQAAAHIGEFVALKNPESGKVFRARVAAKGSAAIDEVAVTR